MTAKDYIFEAILGETDGAPLVDPLEPMDNGEFLGQIAQFGSVTGLEKLNQNFESLAASITSGLSIRSSTFSIGMITP